MKAEGEPILAVVGAINVDLVATGAPLPGPGQTVTGATYSQHHGGKGGNQAVAAARVEMNTSMIGAVGDDQFGTAAIDALRGEGVRTDHVLVTPDAPTGTALIVVDPRGENQITVAPGANALLSAEHAIDAIETLRPHLVLVSLEIVEPAARAAVAWSHDHDVPIIVNPAPFQPWVIELLPLATYLTPNAGELAALGALPAGLTVIETRGAQGARIHTRAGVEDVPGVTVEAVDTTGAGDCFNGVLAAGLARSLPLRTAVFQAVVAAALSVRVPGAREGIPTLDQLRDALAN